MISPFSIEPALRQLIAQAAKDLDLVESQELKRGPALEPPRQASHGDLSTSLALQLASQKKKPPLELARPLAERLESLLKNSALEGAIEKVEVKPPGFINFFLSPSLLQTVIPAVLAQKNDYGRTQAGGGKKVMVEFVSANPTGPLSVAHGRQAAVGDALANLLDFAGYQVTREYYLNDEGTQIDLLGASVLERAKEKLGVPWSIPEGGYKGSYIMNTAVELLESKGQQILGEPNAVEQARDFTLERYTQGIAQELEGLGVKFDVWIKQSDFTSGKQKKYLDESLEKLKARGYLFTEEGALWLKSTAFGDDKDRVVRRSDGRLTYIAADIAYHAHKYARGFEWLVNLWGPDHHGYIPRLKAALSALGLNADGLQIRIIQHCTLKRGDQMIPMSTREGQYIPLQQVIQEVGKDAARFFFLLRKVDAHLEFDLDLAKQHSLENPVYYIQYGHARICRIIENVKKEQAIIKAQVDYALLKAPEELNLARLLRRFPLSIQDCAASLEPFGLVSYLQELAEAFHRFYDHHRVIGSEPALAATRLDLTKAVQTALANGLRLLGVSAPEQM